jgi:membrane-bound lytic murein transglycosylase D
MAMKDSDNRIQTDFDIPAPMRPLVGFWLRIYTEFSARQVVLFDRLHPELIYEVLDFNELHAKSRNAVAYEIVRDRRIEKRLKEYRSVLGRLASRRGKVDPSKVKDPLERHILQVVSHSSHPQHGYRELSKNLRMQTGQRDAVYKGLMNASYFFPKMEEIFKQLEVPIELTRLTLVESSFNLKAHSKSGARGVWQFMLPPGKEYMRVQDDGKIDERLSPIKSTVAAARLLKRNLLISSNWPLAITAYHHGYTGIRKLSPKQRQTAITGSLFDLCDKTHTLGYASSNYYAEFLAILHAEAYKDVFFGDAPPLAVAPNLRFEKLRQPMVAYQYAVNSKMDIEEFKKFNPDITDLRTVLPVGFFVAKPTQNSFAPDDLIGAIRAKLRREFPLRAEQAPTKRKSKRVS